MFCIKVTPCILSNEYDPKISRQLYEPASKVATAKLPTGFKFKTYKELLEAKCHERKDDLGVIVLARLANAISDLQAADARYHRSCCSKFHTLNCNKHLPDSMYNDQAFLQTCLVIGNDRSRFLNSVDIVAMYRDQGGLSLSRRTLFEKV